MSTLKVNKLRDTAGSADAITLDPNGGAVLAGVTTMTTARVTSGIVTNTFIVGAGVTISESGIEASGIGITVANINGAQIGGRRNIIINGAMQVAQRGTSSTSTGYQTIDRMRHYHSGTDEAPTYAQVDVSSGTTPYTEGFRKAFKFTNGNQTSGAGASDAIEVVYRSEGQDIAKSGWNYTSSSSFITLSFWIKSSVAQNFYGHMTTAQGTQVNYPFETGSLTADTWTKIVKTIPGNSNLQFNNDTNKAFDLKWVAFRGTTYTGSGSTLNQWSAYASGSRMPDNTSTWYTTNDATLEITGIQLEVGSQATAFEHRSFGEELSLCQRYFYRHGDLSGTRNYALMGVGMIGHNGSTDTGKIQISSPVRMRTQPTATAIPSGAEFIISTGNGGEGTSDAYCNSAPALWTGASGDTNFWVDFQRTSGGSPDQGIACMVYANNNGANMGFDAEL